MLEMKSGLNSKMFTVALSLLSYQTKQNIIIWKTSKGTLQVKSNKPGTLWKYKSIDAFLLTWALKMQRAKSCDLLSG
ncbi:hypothetical protein CS542_10380 [Pedobacter sp. IW39]|nr:hypothetical protein CS542_10380 [Pedobacter sp. IW39]